MFMATGKGKGKIKIWLFVISVILIAIFYAKVSQESNQQTPPKHTIEKTGSGAVVDFTETTKKIHTAVDVALQKSQFSVRDTKETTKEIPRQKVEGTIRWHTRQVLVTVPADVSAETMKQRMGAAIQSAGGQVLSTQPDTYQGLAVVRLDIGLRDKLEQEDLTIISDRVYLTREKGAAPEPISVPETKGEGKVRGKMALVIDDFGYNQETISAYAAINRPLTFAVIPYRPFSNEAASRGLSSGHQVILHLPMEPLDQGAQSEALTVTVAMSDKEIQSMVQKAIDTVPGLIGVNNHQGSRATADKRVMKDVLSVLKANNLFFVDSRTNGQSVAAETARQMGIQTGENELFIDNTNEVSAVKAKLRTAQEMAVKHGSVTVIGHARMTTATAVSEMIPELEAAGIQLVFVSQLLR
jgi:polysaccharide deacetylase 2 family uncharacterized protein YibQ